jgi:putative transport protein
MTLNKGDRIFVTGEENHIQLLAETLGRVESEAMQTDLLTLTIGLGAGLLLGMITIKFGWLSFTIGSAAGLLLMGILIGFLRAQHPTFGGVPPAARLLLSDLGLSFFMASIGVNAGGQIIDILKTIGPQLIFIGIVVTALPIFVGYVFGRKVLKLTPILLLGSITGAMTSTPSLNVLAATAKSDIPALGYAGTYTFANVFLTIAGSLIMIF